MHTWLALQVYKTIALTYTQIKPAAASLKAVTNGNHHQSETKHTYFNY